ncbi:thiamine phosphate synthase [uncultured Clostridium sp.]|uniref:thiamine phosphate synthase n=1 Tax=uncultured Clostridium sp. TaxID=59620 RepID=UPI0026047CE9|nr:thiamine phosphate synthase [uncultured Clostridium sp.]
MINMERLKLYLVTDSNILEGRDFYFEIEEALRAGIKCIQLREKTLGGKEFLERAKKLRKITNKYNALLIINDRVDIAILSDADGVHVGQSDIPLKEVRKLLGDDKIIGVSTGSIELAKLAKKDGADYIGVGAVFNTTTKLDANNVGIKMLSDIKESVDIPIVAIGGIKLSNLEQIKDININGYAVISDILCEKNIFERSKMWLDALK